MKRLLLTLLLCVTAGTGMGQTQQAKTAGWRTATEAELTAFLPARAPVQNERIETEMRTASGIVNGKGRLIAGVVLITAGYSADGKYTHFFVTEAPIKLGGISLRSGQYVLGWQRLDDALDVKVYDAATGRLVGNTKATRNTFSTRVESFKILPPSDKALLEIGRFVIPYEIGE